MKGKSVVLIAIDVAVAGVADQIAVGVDLVDVGHVGTVVAGVAQSVPVRVALIRVGRFRAIVHVVQYFCMSTTQPQSKHHDFFIFFQNNYS